MLDLYREFVETELAIPVISGRKTDREKFAGALATYAIEALMSDGKALQMGTSHNLGQHFAQVFNIRFEDRGQNLQYVWQTSWGVSTRLIGALVMAHGYDSGLVFPPRVAPLQVVIIPISIGNWKENVLPAAIELRNRLERAGLRVFLDDRSEYTPGWKFSEWEMRGVPLRLEIGPRDVKNNQTIAVRRDHQEKSVIGLDGLEEKVKGLLDSIQLSLLNKALAFQRENTRQVSSYEEFKSVIENKRGFIQAGWCGSEECESRIKEETRATIRFIPLSEETNQKGRCVFCQKEARTMAVFPRSY
jgi:prolyl-tRNA synthetase